MNIAKPLLAPLLLGAGSEAKTVRDIITRVNNLWHTRHLLHLYVQPTSQGDGETVTDAPPSPAYILELP